ncbi:XrtA/PEP-CTERM system histidine kinase PrsK [Motiliproteus sp. SC1-56]|uniref:XrtA/PEP-CTERM system histidine kinase PrsK n=1 Tax=Motiliproteus sp. SC1-56 TaxID=2799565 RepID=UPI001A8FEB80
MAALFSYLSATLTFATVLLLSLFLWRGRLQGIWLMLALVVTVAWAGVTALNSWILTPSPVNQFFLEILRNGAWGLLLWRLLSTSQGEGLEAFWRKPRLWAFGLGLLVLILLNLLQSAGLLSPEQLPVSISHLGPFLTGFAVLVLLEQWYRNIPVEQRWTIKFFCLGLAVIFGYDFLLYSEALLYQRLDQALWDMRGWVCSLMAPLMAVSIARSRDWDHALRFSHQFVFFSTGVLLAGTYLLVMSLVGYYLRWFGGGLGSALQIIFVVLALSLFVLLFISGRFRSVVTVWAAKHFFPYKYDYRQEWIRANNRFASLPADRGYYEQLILGLAEPMDSLGGVIWVREEERFETRGNWTLPSLPAIDLKEASGLLGYAESRAWVIELAEYNRHPQHYPELELPTWLSQNHDVWLLVPLVHQDYCHGLVALAQPRAERTINWEDHDLLKTLGAQLAALIALKKSTDSLAQSRQFEAYHRLSTFVVHDIKNVVAQLSLVVKNAEKHKHNPAFVDDALETLSNAVARMNRMLSQLKQESAVTSSREVVGADVIAREVLAQQKGHLPRVQLRSKVKGAKLLIQREKLVSVLCHLVQNAQDATPDTGRVELEVDAADESVSFKIIDSGCGMEPAFIRERLFKPFDTTKGRAGMGIGVYESRQFVLENRGRIHVDSNPGQGTVFTVSLPVYQPVAHKEEAV